MTQITPYPVRLSPELRQALQEAADAAGRSLQQEILLRLQASFDDAGQVTSDQTGQQFAAQLQDLQRRVSQIEAAILDRGE